MGPGLAQNRADQVGGRIQHLGLFPEIRAAPDKTRKTQNTGDPAKIAIAGAFQLGEDVQRA